MADPRRLAALGRSGLGAQPDEAFDRIARLVSQLLQVPVALVSLVDDECQFFPGAVGLPDPWGPRRQTPLSHSFCQHVVLSQSPLILTDARGDDRVRDNLAIPELGVVAYAGIPLTDLDGNVLGSLCAIDSTPHAWTEAEIATLTDLAAACASELRLRIALEDAGRLNELTRAANEHLTVLSEVTETLGASLDIEDALRGVTVAFVPRLADWCVVHLADPDGQLQGLASTHRDRARRGDADRFSTLMLSDLTDDSATRRVLRTGEPVLRARASTQDLRRATQGSEMTELALGMGFESYITVPMPSPRLAGTAAAAEALGVITLFNGAGRPAFGFDDLRTAVDIGRRAGQAVANGLLYQEQRQVAEVLQQSLLAALPTVPDLDLNAVYRPAAVGNQVGGDWYDAFVQPDGELMASVGDVAGHDIQAAAVMGQLRNLVRGHAYANDDPVHEVVERLDRSASALGIASHATLILARIAPDGPGHRVSWCNAGHPPPLLVRAGGAVEVLWRPPEPPIGVNRHQPRTTTGTYLRRGDTLVLYTDGLIEARGRTIDDGIAALAAQLADAHHRPGPELTEALLRRAADHRDDIAILLVRPH